MISQKRKRGSRSEGHRHPYGSRGKHPTKKRTPPSLQRQLWWNEVNWRTKYRKSSENHVQVNALVKAILVGTKASSLFIFTVIIRTVDDRMLTPPSSYLCPTHGLLWSSEDMRSPAKPEYSPHNSKTPNYKLPTLPRRVRSSDNT